MSRSITAGLVAPLICALAAPLLPASSTGVGAVVLVVLALFAFVGGLSSRPEMFAATGFLALVAAQPGYALGLPAALPAAYLLSGGSAGLILRSVIKGDRERFSPDRTALMLLAAAWIFAASFFFESGRLLQWSTGEFVRAASTPANALGMTVEQALTRISGSAATVISCLLFAVLIRGSQASDPRRDHFLRGLVWGAVVCALAAGGQALFDRPWFGREAMREKGAVFGLMSGPDAYGVSAIVFVSLMLARIKDDSGVLRRVAPAVAPIYLITLFATGSRTGQLGLAAVLALLLVGKRLRALRLAELPDAWRLRGKVISPLLLAVLLVAILPAKGQITRLKAETSELPAYRDAKALSTALFADSNEKLAGRSKAYAATMEIIASNPAAGVGIAGLPAELGNTYARGGAVGPVFDTAANFFLELTADLGIVGGLTVFMLLLVVGYKSLRMLTGGVPAGDEGYGFTAAAALTALIAGFATGTYLYTPEVALAFVAGVTTMTPVKGDISPRMRRFGQLAVVLVTVVYSALSWFSVVERRPLKSLHEEFGLDRGFYDAGDIDGRRLEFTTGRADRYLMRGERFVDFTLVSTKRTAPAVSTVKVELSGRRIEVKSDGAFELGVHMFTDGREPGKLKIRSGAVEAGLDFAHAAGAPVGVGVAGFSAYREARPFAGCVMDPAKASGLCGSTFVLPRPVPGTVWIVTPVASASCDAAGELVVTNPVTGSERKYDASGPIDIAVNDFRTDLEVLWFTDSCVTVTEQRKGMRLDRARIEQKPAPTNQ